MAFLKSFGLISALLLLIASGKAQTVGLLLHTEEAWPGYTLFSNNATTYLIDNCGDKVHFWTSPAAPGSSVYLLENGDLLKTLQLEGNLAAGGSGGGFELQSWEGEEKWRIEHYSDIHHPHHDIAILPNGNFLALVWYVVPADVAESLGRTEQGPFWTERIQEIRIDSEDSFTIVWEWDIIDHSIQDHDPSRENYGNVAEHPELIDINYNDLSTNAPQDWFHMNSIDYSEELDQIMVSVRNYGEIWIIDHSTNTSEASGHSGGNSGKGGDLLYRFGNPEAYRRGTNSTQRFQGQHDAHWIKPGLPNEGQIMVFNNYDSSVSSSIERWYPPIDAEGNYVIEDGQPYGPEEMQYVYQSPSFFASRVSGVRELPNANLLICEGPDGDIFEINTDEEVVWQYINPASIFGAPAIQGGTPMQNQIFRAERYATDFPAFDGKDLSEGTPIELSPDQNDCNLSTANAAVLNTNKGSPLSIHDNTVTDRLYFEVRSKSVKIMLVDLSGMQHLVADFAAGQHSIPLQGFTNGMYLLYAQSELGSGYQRIVKH